jgi:hypothetical protein
MESLEKMLELFAENFRYFVPDSTDAKVLFSLFIDIKNNSDKFSFSESEVRTLISKHHKEDSDAVGSRKPRHKIEERFQTLLRQQLLEKNREKRIVLSDYSMQLCNLFFDKIQPLINPSVIEKILEQVKTTLETSCESIQDLKLWYKTQFIKILKAEIASQTVAMDYQITVLKKNMNQQFKILQYEELVEYCQKQMDIVIKDRKKLTKSFSGLDDISDMLEETHLNKLDNLDFIDIKRSLNETLEHYKFKLEKTGDNISKVKNIVRSLFDIVGKKAFDRKLEEFFYTLIEESQTESKFTRTDSEDSLFYSVEIVLPDFAKTLSIIKDTPDKFIYPEFYERFSVSKNQKTDQVSRNKKNIELAANKSRKRQEQARKIEGWFKDLKEQLSSKNEIDYSVFYMKILSSENDVELAIKGTEYILKKLRKENYMVETSTDFNIDVNEPKNAIWNIKIRKQKQSLN